MSEPCSKFKPLPFRRQFWKTLPGLIREGTVLIGHELLELEDNRNAAQSILIDYVERELMVRFVRPTLVNSCDFYAAFFVSYQDAIRKTEISIWEDMHIAFEAWSAAHWQEPLEELWAAYLTYAFRGYPEPPQSQELYMNMAPVARVYEYLLRGKYGKTYTDERFYEALRTQFPIFLLQYIGMDSVLSALVSMNLHTRETDIVRKRSRALVMRYSFYEPGFFRLLENDALVLKPAYLDEIQKHAYEHGFKEDHVGRTEDRGCPFLFSKVRKAVLDFAVNELIEQHRTWVLAR